MTLLSIGDVQLSLPAGEGGKAGAFQAGLLGAPRKPKAAAMAAGTAKPNSLNTSRTD